MPNFFFSSMVKPRRSYPFNDDIDCDIECDIDCDIECDIDCDIQCDIQFDIDCDIQSHRSVFPHEKPS